MGVLTDFVVARRDQAEQIGRSDSPASDFDGVYAKGINDDTLAALHAILSGEPHDVQFMAGALLFEEPGWRWVLEVPPRLVRRLAAMERKQLDDVASVLADLRAGVEFATGWSVEEVRGVVADLADLCRRAEAKGESVLMWICM